MKVVPERYMPVYVGKEMERFVVSVELMNHPIIERRPTNLLPLASSVHDSWRRRWRSRCLLLPMRFNVRVRV